MAFKGKFTVAPGLETSAAYARIDNIHGNKFGFNAHVNIHASEPVMTENPDKSTSRTDQPVLLHFTVAFDYAEGKDIYPQAYIAAAKDERLAGFVDA